LSALEEHLRQLKQAHRASTGTTTASTVSAPVAPFAVLGLEHRGGERFLSVAALPVSTLAQVHLLRVGDQVSGVPGDWRLEQLEGMTAVFHTAAGLVRLNIP
jgi:hypothetical protein